ncbi:MAG: UDP-3-O-(3-hydroxymyristoyl)glucosamine N-acyltransferase [Candidatus Omnitrophica bacterium]|nr:UDP-3-O-(3-hydroxymyristoyl)glucosamine N-acyltransferase [Candidatus Omnitrophota bacterium]
MVTVSVKKIAELVQGQVRGNENLPISGITNIEAPLENCITFVTETGRIQDLEATPISCILAPPGSVSEAKTLILTANPKAAWAGLLAFFHPARTYGGRISEKASIHPSAVISDGVTVEAFAVIGERVKVGRGSTVRSNAYLDSDVVIGENTVIHPNVMIYDRTQIGSRVIIHAGSVIGSDGFGYVFSGKEQIKVPQVGNVVIEDDVEIGSNVSIDRATMGSTVIRRGVKLDNLVQVAHNVEIGAHSVASSQVGISGSSKIGSYVILAGQVGIADHCEVGDGAILGAQAGLPSKKKIPPRQIFFGSPARPYDVEKRLLASQPFLSGALKQLRELAKKIEALEKAQAG